MLVSTKGRYALSVMIDLAEHDKDGYVPLADIAQRQGISKKYLEAIISALAKEKMVKGIRGKGGGYKLSRKPEEYSVGEILEVTEGTLAVIACLAEENNECPRVDICETLPMWKEYNKMVYDFFYSKKLSDLV